MAAHPGLSPQTCPLRWAASPELRHLPRIFLHEAYRHGHRHSEKFLLLVDLCWFGHAHLLGSFWLIWLSVKEVWSRWRPTCPLTFCSLVFLTATLKAVLATHKVLTKQALICQQAPQYLSTCSVSLMKSWLLPRRCSDSCWAKGALRQMPRLWTQMLSP